MQNMSDINMEDAKDKELVEDHGDNAEQELKGLDGNHDEHSMPSVQNEEETINKKYGGIVPKKPPLISKDHERAYFDSADWALGKILYMGAHKPKGPLEALHPKLQPSPQQQERSRRASYSRADDIEDNGNSNNTEEDDQSGVTDADSSTNTVTEDQNHHE